MARRNRMCSWMCLFARWWTPGLATALWNKRERSSHLHSDCRVADRDRPRRELCASQAGASSRSSSGVTAVSIAHLHARFAVFSLQLRRAIPSCSCRFRCCLRSLRRLSRCCPAIAPYPRSRGRSFATNESSLNPVKNKYATILR